MMLAVFLSALNLAPAYAGDFHTEKYILSCTGLLEAFRSEKGEEALLKGIKSEAQMVQLLYDYGAIFTKEYQDAVLSAFNEIVSSTAFQKGSSSESLSELVRTIATLLDDRGRFGQFVLRVGSILQQRAAVGKNDPEQDRVTFSRIQNLFRAAGASSNGNLFYSAFATVIQKTLMRTAQQAAAKAVPQVRGSGYYSYAYGNPYASSNAGYEFFGLSRGLVERFTGFDPYIFFRETYGATKKRRARSLFSQYKRSMRSGSLSISEASEEDHVYNLTPVQLAYLGHIEILELAGMRMQIVNAIRAFHFNAGFQEIRNAALALGKDKENTELQSALRQRVFQFLRNFDQNKQNLKQLIENLQKAIDTLRPKILQFATLPARTLRLGQSEELSFKEQMIRNKIHLELKPIRNAEVNPEKVLAGLEFFERHREGLEQVLGTDDSASIDWQNVIDDILMTLDMIGLVQEGSL